MDGFKHSLHAFAHDMRQSFLDLITIIGVVFVFQFVVLRTVPENLPGILIGLSIVGVGLAIFMRGLDTGVFALGEGLTKELAATKSRWWIILFAFVIGFTTTIAEPALIAIAHKASLISDGQIHALMLRLVVALSVGLAIVIGVVRIILNHPIHWYIIGGYLVVLVTTYFAPPEIIGLAYDSGGVTTSTVTVPLVAALGIGLASTLKNRNPVIDGFGLIAFASLTPMIFVQLYGIFAYSVGGTSETAAGILESGAVLTTTAAALASLPYSHYLTQLIGTVGDVLPVILTILFFYIFVIKKTVQHLTARIVGFSMVIIGLYAFVVGLELGLFPIGETIATALAERGNVWLIYLFAFTIGFATTIAEPALTTIARKAQTISGGAIRSLFLRLFVAGGVGIGILLGAYRIIHGDSLVWYIIGGYIIVVLFTFFAPKTIVPIAYDSGGVTTSTVTVPIVAALGLGLAASIPGRDPLIDGFGLIAFASLFPVIAVLAYGIFETQSIRHHERRLSNLAGSTVDRILAQLGGDSEEYTPQSRTFKKEIITISGRSGSGASSVARALAERLHYQHFSAGDVFKRVADKHGLSVEELMQKAEKDTYIDREIDEMLHDLGHKHTRIVVDSRLAYHWIQPSYKVYLTVDPDVGAERLRAEEGNTWSDASLEDIKEEMHARHTSKHSRYQKLYALDIDNVEPFDLVIDTTTLNADGVAATIETNYDEWFSKKA